MPRPPEHKDHGGHYSKITSEKHITPILVAIQMHNGTSLRAVGAVCRRCDLHAEHKRALPSESDTGHAQTDAHARKYSQLCSFTPFAPDWDDPATKDDLHGAAERAMQNVGSCGAPMHA
jgi:hypothetical protein